MTAEHACTRKQFNKKLSEFGLIQVSKKKNGNPLFLCFVLLKCCDTDCADIL